MNRLLTDEQAGYLAQLYTGTDVPELHHAPAAYVRRLEREYAERGQTIQWLERTIRNRNKTIERLEGGTRLHGALGVRVPRLCDRPLPRLPHGAGAHARAGANYP